jgi:hypothetical protein
MILERSQWTGTREELATAIDEFSAAKAAHALTVNVPAPAADPIVERLQRDGGEFELRAEIEAAEAEEAAEDEGP